MTDTQSQPKQTREDILRRLERERGVLVERYRQFSEAELEKACTESEADDGAPWRAKDHLAHLAMIERNFQAMVHRTLKGSDSPVGLFTGTSSREEAIARVHTMNERNVEEKRDASFEELLADLDRARADTLALVETLTDEQLTTPIKGAPWGDGTIGGVLQTNAYHERQHLAWVEEGLSGA